MSHIFISYSRKDLPIVQEIVSALGAEGLDTWIDWKSIPKGEDWEQEIYRGIEAADAFLFLISPDSVKSVMCNKEVLHAMRNNKRILPILLREADMNAFVEQAARAEIKRLNWIHCRQGLDDFQTAMRSARDTIRTDFDWLRFHTVLQTQALAWERAHKEGSRLLRGRQLKEALAQISRVLPTTEPGLTQVQRAFLQRSQKVARQRLLLPYQLALVLFGVIFIGGKLFYQVLPIPRACPQVRTVAIQLEASALPQAWQESLASAVEQAPSRTSLRGCAVGEQGTIEARLGYEAPGEQIQFLASLPEKPAYRLDLLQEIREFGPENISEAEAAALLQALAAYAVGEYPRAIQLLEGYNGLSASTLVAQARLFSDDLAGSRQAYERALQLPQTDPAYTGRLRMGAALTWWRPESYYLLSLQGRQDDCLRAAEEYARAEGWIEASPLAYNIRRAFAWFCVDEKDPAYAAYTAWKHEPPQTEPEVHTVEAAETNALAQYLLAVEQGYAETGTRTSYAKHLRGAERLLLARAALSEFYWGVLNDCRAARIWNDAFRSGIISEIERQKLRRLLRPPPLICR